MCHFVLVKCTLKDSAKRHAAQLAQPLCQEAFRSRLQNTLIANGAITRCKSARLALLGQCKRSVRCRIHPFLTARPRCSRSPSSAPPDGGKVLRHSCQRIMLNFTRHKFFGRKVFCQRQTAHTLLRELFVYARVAAPKATTARCGHLFQQMVLVLLDVQTDR